MEIHLISYVTHGSWCGLSSDELSTQFVGLTYLPTMSNCALCKVTKELYMEALKRRLYDIREGRLDQ